MCPSPHVPTWHHTSQLNSYSTHKVIFTIHIWFVCQYTTKHCEYCSVTTFCAYTMEPYTHETLKVHCGPLVLNVAVCTKKKWTETFWTITTWDQKYSEFFSNAAADVPVWLHENNPGAISQTWHGFSRNVCNYMWDLYITTLGSFPLCVGMSLRAGGARGSGVVVCRRVATDLYLPLVHIRQRCSRRKSVL